MVHLQSGIFNGCSLYGRKYLHFHSNVLLQTFLWFQSVTYNSKKKLLKKQGEDDENIYDAPQLNFGNKEKAVNEMG